MPAGGIGVGSKLSSERVGCDFSWMLDTSCCFLLWGGKSNQLLLFPKKIVKAGEEEVERRVKHPKGNDVTTYFGTNQPSATQR